MRAVWSVYCILCAATTVIMLTCALLRKLSETAAERHERRYARRFMQIIAARMLGNEGFPMARFPMCERRGAKEILAGLLATASSTTCIDEPGAVRRIMAANGIEGWLLRRVKHSRGYVRARYLSMLAALPVSRSTADYLRRCCSSGGSHTRFRTMLVAIAADPRSAVRLIAEYPQPLNPMETAELTSMLQRGMLPLAYAPLLESANRNLRMLGLNIVRACNICEAEHRLLGMIADGESVPDECRDEAIETLVALHLPVFHRTVTDRIRSMPQDRRRALFRRLVAEGYSAAALNRIAEGEELSYIESFAASYKRSLVCHSQY